MSGIAVLGAGAWGTALAASLARTGHRVHLWGRDEGVVREIASGRTNGHYLPGIELPNGILPTTKLHNAVNGADAVLSVVPVAATNDVLRAIASALSPSVPVIMCAKGIAPGTGEASEPLLPTAIARAALGDHRNTGSLSGPSFASDVARGLPTAVTVAMPTQAEAVRVAGLLSSPSLRCYPTDDLRGVELGGALKNVVAIGAGIARGRQLGASAHAALVTRGHAEMVRVATALGARADTLSGLSGLGDLLLTASSEQSRNFAHGLALGRGTEPASATVEGVRTAATAATLVRERGLRAPIVEALDAILHRGADIDRTIAALLERPVPAEE